MRRGASRFAPTRNSLVVNSLWVRGENWKLNDDFVKKVEVFLHQAVEWRNKVDSRVYSSVEE